MSISFVYDVSIQGNCENAVFTFLPFYKQNIAFFFFEITIIMLQILDIQGELHSQSETKTN